MHERDDSYVEIDNNSQKEIFQNNLAMWKSKLIDISLNNKFIKYRSTKSSSAKIYSHSSKEFLSLIENKKSCFLANHFYSLKINLKMKRAREKNILNTKK